MSDALDLAIGEFTALVERVRSFRNLPCVCDHSSEQAEEDSLAECTPCHLDSLFDETLEHARGVVSFIERMAESHPKSQPKKRASPKKRSNVVRFQPLGKQGQPDAVWKY